MVNVTGLNDKLTLVQVMAWCLMTPHHYLTQYWVNTLRPRQNGRHFADDIFKCIFLNENTSISINISLKFVPQGRINNIPALVPIMAWRQSGDKPYLNQWWRVYWRIYTSPGLNELSRSYDATLRCWLPGTTTTLSGSLRGMVHHNRYKGSQWI